MGTLDQSRWKPKLAAKLGLTRSHVAVIGLMIKTAEMKQPMQQQDANLVTQIVTVRSSLTRSGLQRDGKIASMCLGNLLGRRKAENVGRLIFAPEGSVQPLQSRVVGQQDIDLTLKPCGSARAVEESRQAAL